MSCKKKQHTTIDIAVQDLAATTTIDKSKLDDIIEHFSEHPDEAEAFCKRFERHKYPEKSIVWAHYYINVQLYDKISNGAAVLLDGFIKTMSTSNLVAFSVRKGKLLAGMGRDNANKAVNELLQTGCVVVYRAGTTRKPTIYMVNPLIAYKGIHNKQLKFTFWSLMDENIKAAIQDDWPDWNEPGLLYNNSYTTEPDPNFEGRSMCYGRPVEVDQSPPPKIKANNKKAQRKSTSTGPTIEADDLPF